MTSQKRDGEGFNAILMTGLMGVCMAPAEVEEQKAVRRAVGACGAVNRCLLLSAQTLRVSIPALIIHDGKQEHCGLQLCINLCNFRLVRLCYGPPVRSMCRPREHDQPRMRNVPDYVEREKKHSKDIERY